MCNTLTPYPDGFELDHIKALTKGGEDTDENCQILCAKCHEVKTASDLGYKIRPRIGLDGWPID